MQAAITNKKNSNSHPQIKISPKKWTRSMDFVAS